MKKIVLALILSLISMTSYATTNNDDGAQLHKGIYIRSGRGYCYQTGQYSQDYYGSEQVEIIVYEKTLNVYQLPYRALLECNEYIGEYGTARCYRDLSGTFIYYVFPDGTMYREWTYNGWTFRYDISKVL